MDQDQYTGFMSYFAIFIIGFTYLIGCFDKKLAGAYFLFLIISSIYLIIIGKIRKKRSIKNGS